MGSGEAAGKQRETADERMSRIKLVAESYGDLLIDRRYADAEAYLRLMRIESWHPVERLLIDSMLMLVEAARLKVSAMKP